MFRHRPPPHYTPTVAASSQVQDLRSACEQVKEHRGNRDLNQKWITKRHVAQQLCRGSSSGCCRAVRMQTRAFIRVVTPAISSAIGHWK